VIAVCGKLNRHVQLKVTERVVSRPEVLHWGVAAGVWSGAPLGPGHKYNWRYYSANHWSVRWSFTAVPCIF